MLAVGPAAVATRGSTIVGGLHVQAGVWAQGADASAALANTVVRAQSSGPDLLAGGGTITASSSAFTKVSSQGGGAAPAVGSGTNVAGDPQFVGPVTVDWPDFREAGDSTGFEPQRRSPLVDRGDPALVESGETDIDGSDRSIDGDGDCVARPDIGAFELTVGPCNPAPVVSRFHLTNRVFAPTRKHRRATTGRRRVRRGTTFLFRLSERASARIRIERIRRGRRVAGRCVKPRRRYRSRLRCRRYRKVGTLRVRGRRGRNRKRFSGRIKGRALRRASYRATLVATDAQGARSKPRRLRFRIVRP